MAGASFNADGTLVVTASDDHTARVWLVADGQEVTVLRGSTGPVGSAAFSPGGAAVVTASTDGLARLYSCELCAPWRELLNVARSRVTRSLTPAERRAFLPADG